MRLVASLAVVVGLMLLLARLVGKRYGARAGAPVQVLHRQPLSRSASVTVLAVGGRVLVVGTTDHQVSLLTELDPDEMDLEVPVPDDLVLVPPVDLARPDTGLLDAGHDATTQVRPVGAHRAAHRAEGSRRADSSRRPDFSRRATDDGALAGSVLSPQTWRQAIAAATGKAS